MKSEESRKDIKVRAFDFGIRIVKLVRAMKKDPASYALANQIVRSGTSIGANIEEAQGALSRKDFIHSMQISLKESRETFYWLKIIGGSGILPTAQLQSLLLESEEIVKILTTIVKNAKVNMRIVTSE